MDLNVAMPLQLVIDDVGWWCGTDGSAWGEPFRTGSPRDHVPADYAAIASLGRRLDMRPQAAMILCEWDRENILRRVPTATWMGEEWDNSRWVGPHLGEAAAVLRENVDHVELTVHGVGHEYWENGVMSRAEWHDMDHRLRPKDQVRAHLDAFAELLEQNDLGPFPESFVPAAFLHRFGLGEDGIVGLLRERGVRHICVPWTMARERDPQEAQFGLECGIMTVNRGDTGIPWPAFDTLPQTHLQGPICGVHWPNLLHVDPARNEEAVDRWVELLDAYGRRPDAVLSRDTAECWSQLAYHTGTAITVRGARAELDFSRLNAYGIGHLYDTFTIKAAPEGEARFSSPDLEVVSQGPDAAPGSVRIQLRRPPGAARAELVWETA